jgi:hypothetical protein
MAGNDGELAQKHVTQNTSQTSRITIQVGRLQSTRLTGHHDDNTNDSRLLVAPELMRPFGVIVLLESFVPARKVTGMNPTDALRQY